MKQLRWLVPLIVVVLAGAFSAALAHEGEHHDSKTVLGTVKAVQKDKIEIETPEGKKVTVMLEPDTKYTKDGKDLTKDAVEPGMRVAMEVTEGEHGEMVCHRMMLGMMGDMHGMHGKSSMHDEHHGDNEKGDPHRH